MRIFKQGYFSTPVRDLRGVVSFRHLGCLPLDVSLAGTVGGLIYVGEVQLKPAAPGQVGGIRGRLAFPGASNLDEAVLSISVEMGKTSTASGGSEPPGTRPVPILRRAGKDGAFLLENLAPTPHFISIECPSALKKVLWGISIEPGTVRDLGQINLERPLQVAISWFTAPTPSFEQARLEQTKVIGDGEWQAQPRDYGFDLRLEQQEGRLLFSYGYGPCRLTDLGERELDAKVSINTDALLFRKPRGEVQAGHVYLLHQQHFQPQYWVLFRIDSIGPSGEPEQSPKR
jgi:hypothetical protein